MTNEQVVRIATKYRSLFADKFGVTVGRRDPEVPTSVEHLAWMCDQLIMLFAVQCDRGSVAHEKGMRWLGFLQGAMWAHGIRTVDEMRADNTEVSGGNQE